MSTPLPLPEYDQLMAHIRTAWVRLNQAGDTPESHRAILDLQGAWLDAQAVAEILQPGSTPESLVARHHHSLRKNPPDATEILRRLSMRAGQIQSETAMPAENVPDALLVHSAIPVLWRIIGSLRRAVRARRPRKYYLRAACRLALVLAGLAMVLLLLRLVEFALPGGCRITYYGPGSAAPFRGWSTAAALVRDYGDGRPLSWMHRDGWTACWKGKVLVPETADYAFFAQCQGGMRLWLDDVLVIDNWTSKGWQAGAQHANRRLEAGPHAFRMEFRDRGGRSAVRVSWTGGPVPPNTIVGSPYLRKY